MQPRPLRLIPVFAITATAIGVGLAAPAAADCNYSGGSTLCSSTGTVRGGSAPPRPTYNPYPCNGYTCSYYDNYDPGLYLDFGRGGGISIGGGRN